MEPAAASLPVMTHADRRIALLHRMALLCAALVLTITSLSAFMRLSKAGLGCQPWPQCYGQSLRELQQGGIAPKADAATATAAARVVHRIAAVAALIVVIMMVMTTMTTRPVLWREGRIALALLGLTLFLAVLGLWTANSRVPAVALGNLLAGFAMFALSCRLAQASRPRTQAGTTASPRLAHWAWLGVALLATQIALGGLVSASYAGLSCPMLASCDLGGASWQTVNPWYEPLLDLAAPTNPAGALANVIHRAGALVVAAVLLPLGMAAWRSGRRAGGAIVMLLLIQGALGVVLVIGALPLAAALAHNVVAALLLAAVLGLASDSGRS
jgi:cytochrome c oxidase assembly protein subunit 15